MEVDGSVSLPEDISFQVLSWLPVKALWRFRCVSKAWHALICSPAFIAAHKCRTGPLLVGSFDVPCDPTTKEHNPLAPDFNQASELRVMDMNGNVLRVFKDDFVIMGLSPTRLDLVCVEGRYGSRVIDPATGRVVRYVHDPVRGFIESLSGSFFFRFGRAAPSGEYKIARFLQPTYQTGQESSYICEVATLGDADRTWRRRQRPPLHICRCTGCSVAINGVIYFLSIGSHIALGFWNRIARLDLESEDWKTVIDGPTPRHPREGARSLVAIGELNGTLTMVQTLQSRQDKSNLYTDIGIWLLLDSDRGVWVKGYSIQSPGCSCRVKVLEVLLDGTLLLLKTVEKERILNLTTDFPPESTPAATLRLKHWDFHKLDGYAKGVQGLDHPLHRENLVLIINNGHYCWLSER